MPKRSPQKAAVRAAPPHAALRLEAMSNLRSRDTGVAGTVIWVSAGEFAVGTDLPHDPRIKVVRRDKLTTERLQDAVSVKLTDPPIVIGTLPGAIRRQVIRFVALNRDVLLSHWNGEIDTSEMLDVVRRV